MVKKYEGKVILFKASITPPGRTKELSMGWNNSMVADSETIVIQGDHMSIFKEPQVKELALKLDAIIAATK